MWLYGPSPQDCIRSQYAYDIDFQSGVTNVYGVGFASASAQMEPYRFENGTRPKRGGTPIHSYMEIPLLWVYLVSTSCPSLWQKRPRYNSSVATALRLVLYCLYCSTSDSYPLTPVDPMIGASRGFRRGFWVVFVGRSVPKWLRTPGSSNRARNAQREMEGRSSHKTYGV